MIMLSCRYDMWDHKVVFSYYDTESQAIRTDGKSYVPYVYSDRVDIKGTPDMSVTRATAINTFTGRPVAVLKARPKGQQTPREFRDNALGRLGDAAHETDIRIEESCTYDMGFRMGTHYTRQYKQASMPQDSEATEMLKRVIERSGADAMPQPREYAEHQEMAARLLGLPVPDFRRVAVDIEVESSGAVPDPAAAVKPVTAIGFSDGRGFERVLVLARDGLTDMRAPPGSKFDIRAYATEKEMISAALKTIQSYPIVLTYNGDAFDLPYLYNRARNLGLNADAALRPFGDSTALKIGIHVDLYRVFSNRSLQIYAFGNRYDSHTLDDVSKAMLGEGKMEHGGFEGMGAAELAAYCHHDAALTHRLSSYDGSIVMRLLVIISRIANMPLDTVSRMGVSTWLRGMMYNEHRRRKMLIPSRAELAARTPGTASKAISKGKKYRGAMVIQPKSGIYFNVAVMDFASLYPSIIKVRNLSYETVRCIHRACRTNAIPETEHWACTQRNGIVSTLIGSLRDLRVNYFKPLSGDDTVPEETRRIYGTVASCLKVILNASYGVLGSDFFSLYFLPLADSTTAVGRHILENVMKQCSDSGMNVLYGDTDSLFVADPPRNVMDGLMADMKERYGIDLEIEKEYRYLILSDRKKNYLGVTKAGRVDVKGLSGKKSHTPEFIKELFRDVVGVLSGIHDADGFESAKRKIRDSITACITDMDNHDIPLHKFAFKMKLQRNLNEYSYNKKGAKAMNHSILGEADSGQARMPKSVPQHIRAAIILGDEVQKGDTISYVKTSDHEGVQPMQMANYKMLDLDKYREFIESVLEQLTSPMGIDLGPLVSKRTQTQLGAYI